MTGLKIEYRSPGDLKPTAANARTHSAKQVQQIGRSIGTFGFNNPVLLDRHDEIVAGHGRVAAAIELGMPLVPTIRLEHLSPEQKRAYVIADNRLAELAGWDSEMLAIELQGLMALDLDFEITDIGFEMPQVELILAGAAQTADSELDDVTSPESVPPVARPGDLWLLGEHRIFCGDALDAASYRALLGAERAQMVFTDPPYNVPIQGHVCGKGRAKHDSFVMASGEMSEQQFVGFLRRASQRMAEVSSDGALHFICMDWRHLRELLEAARPVYSELKNLAVWVKTNGGMGSLYRSQHELVGIFKVGKARHINNVELGRHGRDRTNVWTYAGMNSFQEGRDEALKMHPTVKPVALIEDALYDCSIRNGIILDPFGGSGTTIIAAERTHRRARLIELDPRYVDVTLHRYWKLTGQVPVNAWTGETMPIQDGFEGNSIASNGHGQFR